MPGEGVLCAFSGFAPARQLSKPNSDRFISRRPPVEPGVQSKLNGCIIGGAPIRGTLHWRGWTRRLHAGAEGPGLPPRDEGTALRAARAGHQRRHRHRTGAQHRHRRLLLRRHAAGRHAQGHTTAGGPAPWSAVHTGRLQTRRAGTARTGQTLAGTLEAGPSAKPRGIVPVAPETSPDYPVVIAVQGADAREEGRRVGELSAS